MTTPACGNCWDHCSRCFTGGTADGVKAGIPTDLHKWFSLIQKVEVGQAPSKPILRGDLIVWFDAGPGDSPFSHCAVATGQGDLVSQYGLSVEHWRLLRNLNRSTAEDVRFNELHKNEPVHNIVHAGEITPFIGNPSRMPAGYTPSYTVYRITEIDQLSCEHLCEQIRKPMKGEGAHWHGRIRGTEELYATRAPGLFGVALSSPHWISDVEVDVTLREEKASGRAIVESLAWSDVVSDLYYENPDGTRLGAGSGGAMTLLFGESDLTGDVPPDREWLANMAAELAAEKDSLSAAEVKLKEATTSVMNAPTVSSSFAGRQEFNRALHGYRQSSSSAHSESTQAAQEALSTAMTNIADEFSSRVSAVTRRYEESLANASAEDQLTASRKLQDEMAALTGEFDVFKGLFELAVAEASVHELRRQVQDAERRLANAENMPVSHRARGDAGIRMDASGRGTAFVEFGYDRTEDLAFTVDVIPLKFVGRLSVEPAPERVEPRPFEARIPLLAHGFKGEAPAYSGRASISYHDEKRSGQPGLIGGGASRVSVSFRRIPAPARYEASIATVTALRIYPVALGSLLTIEAFQGDPLDALFSDGRRFRFMHVLAVFVETPDGFTIAAGDFLTAGPNGEQSVIGGLVEARGAKELPQHAASMKVTVDGMEVMIFEQVYGIREGRAPPEWTSLRIGIAADGTRAAECFDFSMELGMHFLFEEGAYRSTIRAAGLTNDEFGPLDERDGYFMFDPAGAEEWWRARTGRAAGADTFGKASAHGNPWNIGQEPH